MDIYKVPAAILLALTLSACGGGDGADQAGTGDTGTGDTATGDTGSDQTETLIPGVGVNGNLQAVPSKSEG